MLDGVVVVAVKRSAGPDAQPEDPHDVARLQALAPGAGLVEVALSRADLEAVMDDVERELAGSGELAGFLQMSPDGFRSTVRVVVDAPVPQLRAWAARTLPAGTLQVQEQEPGTP